MGPRRRRRRLEQCRIPTLHDHGVADFGRTAFAVVGMHMPSLLLLLLPLLMLRPLMLHLLLLLLLRMMTMARPIAARCRRWDC